MFPEAPLRCVSSRYLMPSEATESSCAAAEQELDRCTRQLRVILNFSVFSARMPPHTPRVMIYV